MGSTPRTQCGQSRQWALPLVLIAPEREVHVLSGLFQDGDMQDPPRPLRTVRAGDEGGAGASQLATHVHGCTWAHTPLCPPHAHTCTTTRTHMSIHVHNHTHVHTRHTCVQSHTQMYTHTLTHTPRAAVTLGSPLRRGAFDRVLTDARGPTLQEGETG